MFERAKIDPSAIPDLIAEYRSSLKFMTDQENPYFMLDMANGVKKKQQDVLMVVEELTENIRKFLM